MVNVPFIILFCETLKLSCETLNIKSTDEFFMKKCIELAKKGAGKVSPNPLVGCVIVDDSENIIAQGYHDGSAKVGISSTEQAKIIAGNIKHGVSILGITGDYNGDSTEVPQSKTVNAPLSEDLTVTPDSGYTCLSQVIVRKVPYATSANSAGGTTVTIG